MRKCSGQVFYKIPQNTPFKKILNSNIFGKYWFNKVNMLVCALNPRPVSSLQFSKSKEQGNTVLPDHFFFFLSVQGINSTWDSSLWEIMETALLFMKFVVLLNLFFYLTHRMPMSSSHYNICTERKKLCIFLFT